MTQGRQSTATFAHSQGNGSNGCVFGLIDPPPLPLPSQPRQLVRFMLLLSGWLFFSFIDMSCVHYDLRTRTRLGGDGINSLLFNGATGQSYKRRMQPSSNEVF